MASARRRLLAGGMGAVGAAAGMVILAAACGVAREAAPGPARGPALQALSPRAGARAASTSRVDLEQTVSRMSARLARDPGDAGAAVALADALLRQSRVLGDGALALRAEQVLVRALTADSESYSVRRSLATVYLSQHRFGDAMSTAQRCLAERQDDASIYGVMGDAHLELGEYKEAFQAFDRMNEIEPNAASYARASYARELQGDLDGAIRLMRMAADATPPNDQESTAWHAAQLGDLLLVQGTTGAAEREFERAAHTFPGHPLAISGLARVALAAGRFDEAWRLVQPRLELPTVSPSDLEVAGNALSGLGRSDEASRHYRLAEAAWRSEVPEPTRLARFLAGKGNAPAEALALAESEWRGRRDIFTADALAWSHFRLGHLDEAYRFIVQAVRTGTRDHDIRAHEAAILAARSPRLVAERRR